MYGGLSPELSSMGQIQKIMRPTDVSPLDGTAFPFLTLPFFFEQIVLEAMPKLREILTYHYRSTSMAYYAIFSGQIQTGRITAGIKVTGAYPLSSSLILSRSLSRSMDSI